MSLVKESQEVVLLVPFPLGDVDWTARVKQTQHGDKAQLTVVQAFTADGRTCTSGEWDRLLAQAGRVNEFDTAVLFLFLMQTVAPLRHA